MAIYDWQFMGDQADRSKPPMANKRKYRKAIPLQEIPRLPGWYTIEEAARYIGMSKVGLNKQIFDAHAFNTVHKVGKQPVYVIAFEEVHDYKLFREEKARFQEERKRLKAEEAEFGKMDEYDKEVNDEG